MSTIDVVLRLVDDLLKDEGWDEKDYLLSNLADAIDSRRYPEDPEEYPSEQG
jgi:hypothetical protein